MQSLKKTAMEYYLLTDKMKDLSVKYVNLNSKISTEAEKLETAKKPGGIQQLEKDKARLQAVLQAYGIEAKGQKEGLDKEVQR